MQHVVVVDGGLEGLAAGARRVRDDVGEAAGALGRGGAGDLGEVAPVVRTLTERWVGGLDVAAAAVEELAVEVLACAAAYRAADDAAAVDFQGLDR